MGYYRGSNTSSADNGGIQPTQKMQRGRWWWQDGGQRTIQGPRNRFYIKAHATSTGGDILTE